MKLGSTYRTVLCALILFLLTGLLGTLAYAQSVAPMASSVVAQPGMSGVTDVFIGRNTRGPYVLSWKKIEPGTETIVRAGMTLSRATDYQIDYESGTLAFTSPLDPDSIVRVTYSYKPESAIANSAGVVLPIALNVFDRESSSLQVLGLYKEQTPGKPETGATIFGLGGKAKSENSEFSTTFLTTKQNEGSDQEADFLERSGMKLGAKTSALDGRLNLSGSYARAGDQFAGAKEYGLKGGTEIYDIGAAMQASDGVRASMSFKRVEDVSGEGKGASSTAQQQMLVLGTDKTPKLTATRSTQETVNADGETTTTTDTQSVGLNITPISGLQVSGSHTLVDSDTTGGSATTDLNLSAAPRNDLTIKARYIGRESETAGSEAVRDISVTSTPTKQLSVNARYVDRDSESLGLEQSRDIRFEAQPLASMNVKVMGAYGEKETAEGTNTSKEARIELQPVAGATIGGGYKETELGASTATVKDVSGAVKASQYLELSGAYKSREQTGEEQLDSTGMRIALSPGKRFRLTGSYELNPEDKNGVVQRLDSRALGLETRIGSVNFTGEFALKDEYLLGRQAQERQVGMNLPLFGHGRLTTGYRQSETRLTTQEAQITYSLGYQHNVGNRFTFSVAGQMTQYEREWSVLEDQTDYRADAKLGVRF